MTAAWMLHAIWIAALLGVGARLFDWTGTAYRRPVRHVWVVAIAAVAMFTVVAPLLSGAPDGTPGAVVMVEARESSTTWALVREMLSSPSDLLDIDHALLAALDVPLRATWIISSLALLLILVLSHRRLRRERETWGRATFAGTSVRVSPDLGPAVVGTWRPEIVVPSWALELDDGSKALIARHELEHVRGRDQLLLMAGTAALVIAPWNPALWWMLQRLRLAIEIDCDRRSIGQDPVRAYAELLLELGSRVQPVRVPVAALAEGRSMLVRRIRSFTGDVPRARASRAVLAAVIAAIVVGTASATPLPEPRRPALGGQLRFTELDTARFAEMMEQLEEVRATGVYRAVPDSARRGGGRGGRAIMSRPVDGRPATPAGSVIRARAVQQPDTNTSSRR